MTTRAFVNGRVLLDEGFAVHRAVLVEGERIAAVVEAKDPRVREAYLGE